MRPAGRPGTERWRFPFAVIFVAVSDAIWIAPLARACWRLDRHAGRSRVYLEHEPQRRRRRGVTPLASSTNPDSVRKHFGKDVSYRCCLDRKQRWATWKDVFFFVIFFSALDNGNLLIRVVSFHSLFVVALPRPGMRVYCYISK